MKNNLTTDFKQWLKTNVSRFVVAPNIENMTKDSFDLTFENVHDFKIEFSLYGIQIWSGKNVSKRGNLVADNIDLMTEFHISEEKDVNGYYCDQCLTREYFKTRHELWVDHVYKPFLDWVNENILPDKYVCIYETENQGALWIKILAVSALEKDEDLHYRIHTRPIISTKV